MKSNRTLFVIFGSLLVGSVVARGGDWPRFLGPAGTGVVVSGESVKRSWPPGGPQEVWKIKTGEGFGGASIADGKVFLLDRKGRDADVFRVLDLKTGTPLWEHEYQTPVFKGGYAGSRGTPTIDGDHAYTIGIMGNFNCFDIAAKKVVWSKSLPDDFGAKAGGWGFAASPLVVGDAVIVAAAGGPNGLVALHKKTAKALWKTEAFGKGGDTYTSPMLVTLDGQEQVVNWHKGVLAGFDSKNGKTLWQYEWRTDRPIPQPVSIGDGRFFLTIGYGGGCAMIRVSKSGAGKWDVAELFQDNRSGSKVPPALLYDGHIYTNSDDNKKGLQCLDLNGDVKWETGAKPEFGLGSLIIVDGIIFIINGSTGDLVMAEASPKGYKELARARVLGGRDIWAPLALSNGRLIVRDQSQMKCLNVGS